MRALKVATLLLCFSAGRVARKGKRREEKRREETIPRSVSNLDWAVLWSMTTSSSVSFVLWLPRQLHSAHKRELEWGWISRPQALLGWLDVGPPGPFQTIPLSFSFYRPFCSSFLPFSSTTYTTAPYYCYSSFPILLPFSSPPAQQSTNATRDPGDESWPSGADQSATRVSSVIVTMRLSSSCWVCSRRAENAIWKTN